MNKKLFMIVSLIGFSFMTLVPGAPTLITPNASRVYGDRFVPEVLPYQELGAQGTMDGSFGVNGLLSLAPEYAGAQAKSVEVLSDGSILTLLDNGTNSQVIKYLATGDVDTAFAADGIYILSSLSGAQNLMIDSQNRILVMGSADEGNNPWIRRLTPDGELDPAFALINGQGWSFIGAIGQQTSGRLIAVGQALGTNYGRIVAYTQDGLIDTTFGTSGIVLFDGGAGHPTSINPLYSVSIASDNSIFVGYKNGSAYLAKFNANGALVSAFNPAGTVPGVLPNALGASAVTATQVRIALNQAGNICIAAQSGNNILLRLYNGTTGATIGGFGLLTISYSSNVLNLSDLIALANGKFLVVGYDATTIKMRVTQVTSTGLIDTTGFNVDGITPGSIEFSAGSPNTNSILLSGSIAPDGRLYGIGYQVNSAVTTPYLSRIFDEAYVTSVAQFPFTQQQGNIDLNFGTNSSETFRGAQYLFNGNYGATLQQKANYVIELAYSDNAGKILVGSTGYTNSAASNTRMLTRLNADGSLDTSFNETGKLTLPSNSTYGSQQYITSLIEDQDGNIYVTGYVTDNADGNLGSLVSKYDADGNLLWDYFSDVDGQAALSVGIQSSQRVLVFESILYGVAGRITALNPSTGAIDTTFHAGLDHAGQIIPGDFALDYMGAIYGAVIDAQNNIFIAYRNQNTLEIDIAAILADGSQLIQGFANNGVYANVFGTTVSFVGNLAMVMDADDRLIVGIGIDNSFVLSRIFIDNGSIDPSFGTGGGFSFSAGNLAILNQLTALSNDEIIVTGANDTTDDSMIIARVTSAGALDSVFNSQGTTPGILPIQVGQIVPNYYARAAQSLVVQAANGNMVLVGNEQQSASQSIPMALRTYGAPGTTQVRQSPVYGSGAPGTLDTNFGNADGAQDFTALIAAGSLQVVYSYLSTSEHAGQILVGINTTDNQVKIARVNVYNLSLDTSFGSSGITTLTTLSGLSGLNCISLDSNNNILLGGTYNGVGWAQRLTPDGIVDVLFANLINLVEINGIYQQKSGRYILAGRQLDGKGVLVAFQDLLVDPATTLQVDTTFSPIATTPGWYTIGTTGLYNISINNDDTIFTAYSDTTVKLAKITANGSGLVASFNSGAVKNTGITPRNAKEICVGIDSFGNVIVSAAVVAGGASVSVGRYSASTGVFDTTFNGGSINNITGLGTVGVALADMLITAENSPAIEDKIILMGYNTGGGNGRMFMSRLAGNGQLDTSWNAAPTSPDVPGILTFTIDGSLTMFNGSIYVNGQIFAAGTGIGNTPLLMAVFGDNYIGQTEQEPFQVAAGIIDSTIDVIGGSNALNLNAYLPSVGLAGFVATAMHIYDDGSMLIGCGNYYAYQASPGTVTPLTKILKLNKAFQLDTTFNATGTPGYVTIANSTWVSDITVLDGTNQNGSILVVGYATDNSLMTHRFSSTGADLGLAISDTTVSSPIDIKQSSNGRILVSLFQVEDPYANVIAAYTANGSGPDLSFGNNGQGQYVIGVNNVYTSYLSIDSYDRLYYAYPVQGDGVVNIVIDRLMVDGTSADNWFDGSSIVCTTNDLSGTWAALALDEAHNRVVVAAHDGNSNGNNVYLRRYNIVTGANDGGLITFTLAGQGLLVENMFIDEDQYTYLYGYSNQNKIFVARITPDWALDTSYNAAGTVPGVAYYDALPNSYIAYAGGLHPDRRVYTVGYNLDQNIPSISRFFGDFYTLAENTATFTAVPGTSDLTLDPGVGADGGIILTGDGALTAAIPAAIYCNPDGSSYVAFLHQDAIDMFVAKFNADYALDPSFNSESTPGISPLLTMQAVNKLIVDGQGNIVVCGINTYQNLIRFSANGSSYTFFDHSILMSDANTVAQQASGRYLVAGKLLDGEGIILAYQHELVGDATTLVADTTYGQADNSAYYSTGVNFAIDDMVLDSNDNAYIVYRNESNHVIISKVDAQGGGLVSGFVGGDTNIVATGRAFVGINNAGNILVAAPTSGGITTILYNGTSGNNFPTPSYIALINSPIVTSMTGVGSEFAIAAYNTAPAMLTLLVNSSGALDTTFNPTGVTPGIASSDPENAVAMYDLSVQADGKFVMVGKQTSPSVNPVLMRVYGSPYVTADAEFAGIVDAGILDTTLNPTTGALNLDTALSINLAGYVAKQMYTYANNNILLVFDNGTNTIVARIHKDFTLDTSFNSPNGYVTVTGKSDITGLHLDENSNIFITGGVPSWVAAYADDGTVLSGFASPTVNIATGSYAIEVQSPSRILICGQATYGTVYAYSSTTGQLDTTFGNGTPGQFATTSAYPLTDIAIDSVDRIVSVFVDGAGATHLIRINAGGTDYDQFLIAGPTPITNVTGNQAQVLNDQAGNMIVAAATATGFALRCYDTNGADAGPMVTISAGTLGTAVLGTIYTTTDGKFALIGYESVSHTIIVARITSVSDGFILDTTFNPAGSSFTSNIPGILATTLGSMAIADNGTIYNDDRIYLVGSNLAEDTPYMGRVFGDSYVHVVQQSDVIGALGELDTGYGTGGALNVQTLFGYGANARALLTGTDGSVYLAAVDGDGLSKIIKLDSQGAVISAFGTAGILSFEEGTYDGVMTMDFDDQGNILLTGYTSVPAGWIVKIDPITGTIINTFVDASIFTATSTILQQANDRIIVAGSNLLNQGLVAGYLPDGSALDITFGQSSSETLPNGTFADAVNINGVITSMAIDSKNRIVVGYTQTSDEGSIVRAAVARILPNGTALDADVDTYVGFASVGYIADVFGSTNIVGNVYVAVDSFDNVIVATVNNDLGESNNIVVKQYNSTGSTVLGSYTLTSLSALSAVIVNENTQITLVGYNPGGGFSLQLNPDLTINTNYGTDGFAEYTISSLDNLVCARLNSAGFMYAAGSGSENPLLLRIYSERFVPQNDQQPTAAVPGTFDLALNGTGGANLAGRSVDVDLNGFAGAAVCAYASSSNDLLILLDDGVHTKLAQLNADGFIDTTFGLNGFGYIDMPTGGQKITIDDAGNILVCGANWAYRFSADGTSFNSFINPEDFVQGSDIGQQRSGRILVSGYDLTAEQGALVAFESTGMATDTSFGLLSQISPTNDRYLTGIDANIDSFVINNDDTIIIAYRDGNFLTLRKLNADGSAVISSFGTVTYAATTASGKVLLIKDENQDLIFAGVSDGNEITVVWCSADGLSLSPLSIEITAPVITGLQETSTGQLLISGTTEGAAFIVRLIRGEGYSLDPSFGTDGIFIGTQAGLDQANAMTDRLDGRIAILGQDASANPILLSVNGDPYVSQNLVATQFPATVGAAGTIDNTLSPVGADAWNLTSLNAGSLNLSNSYARQFYAYPNGKMLIAFNKGTNTTVIRLNKDQSLDTSFGNSGSALNLYTSGPGFITILGPLFGTSVVHDMFVDNGTNADGSIYLTGTYGGSNSWLLKLSANGYFGGFSGYNPFDMTSIYANRISTNTRKLVTGGTDVSGIIMALTSEQILDTSFGNGTGAYQTGVNSPIVDLAMDQYDRMYIAYLNGSVITVQRILDNGGSVDTSFVANSIPTLYSLSSTQIRVALDEANQQFVVAVQDGTSANNVIKVARYNMIDGSDTGAIANITVTDAVVNLVDLFIDSDENIYVIGNNSTDNNILVARVASTNATSIALDPTYGVNGIANVSPGSNMTQVQAGLLDLDGRVYVVGQQDTPTPAMARLFGDNYYTQDSTANAQGLPGALDLTLNPGVGAFDLSADGSFGTSLDGYTGRAIFANADGTSYVAFGDGTNVILGKLDCDQQPVASGFGTAGLTDPLPMAVVNSLAVDSQGRILIAGTNAGAAQVYRYPVDGLAPTIFAGIPTLVVGNKALEQKSGRIMLAGRKTSGGSAGVVFAYQNTGLAADITFGPQGSNGFYALPVNQPVDDMVIDNYDDIYLVYRDTTVKLIKLTADGSGLDVDFASGVIINTGIAATNTAHIGINNDGQILVAAPVGSTIQTAVYYTTSGTLVGSVQTIATGQSVVTQVTATADQFDGDSNFVVSAYQVAGSPAHMLTLLIDNTGLLNTTFASGTGIAQTSPLSMNQANGVTIQPDGRFLMVGQNTVSSVNHPLIERIYGAAPYKPGYAQFPVIGVVGTLDTTLNPASGVLDFAVAYPSAALEGYTAKRMYTYADGRMLFALDNGTAMYLMRIYKDGTLDTSFNSEGLVSADPAGTVTSLVVDSNQNIYVGGSVEVLDSNNWVMALRNDGTSIFNASGNLPHGGYAMAVQSMGRTLMSGIATNGTIVSYTTSGELDPEFGIDGVFTLEEAAFAGVPIADIAVNNLDQIAIITVLEGVTNVNLLDASGSIVLTTVASGDGISNVTGNQVRITFDNEGYIVIAAATSTGFQLKRYDLVGHLVASSNNINASTFQMANMYALSSNKILVVGYTTGCYKVLARFNADLSLDTSFNPGGSPAGVFYDHVGNMRGIYDGTIYADDRIYFVGVNSDNNPAMARLFGDAYATNISDAATVGVPGTLDPTLGTAENGSFQLNTLAGLENTIPKNILVHEDGSMIIALQTNEPSSQQTLVANLNEDLSYNEAGLITISTGAPEVTSLSLDQLNNILVAGNSGTASWINRFDSATGSAVGTFPSVSNMTSVVGILNQSIGRVILGGDQDSTHGLLVGFAPLSVSAGATTSAAKLDQTFGVSARFIDDNMTSVNSFVIDDNDRILVGFVNGSILQVARVLPNASGLDTTFGAGGIVTTNVTTAAGVKPARVVLNSLGNIIVATTTTAGMSVRGYDNAGIPLAILFNITNSAAGFTAPVISQILTTNLNQIILLGYDNVEFGNMFMMRLTADGLLDTTFNPAGTVPGILAYSIDEDPINILYAGAIASDGRILAVGYEENDTLS